MAAKIIQIPWPTSVTTAKIRKITVMTISGVGMAMISASRRASTRQSGGLLVWGGYFSIVRGRS